MKSVPFDMLERLVFKRKLSQINSIHIQVQVLITEQLNEVKDRRQNIGIKGMIIKGGHLKAEKLY